MKKTILMGALLAVPTITFAGGYGTADWNTGTSAPIAAPAAFTGSSEDPANALASRQVSGSENDNYLRYNYGFIPKSYWEEVSGVDLDDVNGFIELEEYLGETRRETFAPAGEDLDREDERQERAKNKALRLRAILGY